MNSLKLRALALSGALLSLLLGATHVLAQPYGNGRGHGNGNGGYGDIYDNGGRDQIVSKIVNIQVAGSRVISLQQVLGFGAEFRGKDVKAVMINAQVMTNRCQPTNSRPGRGGSTNTRCYQSAVAPASVQLLVNGMQEGRAQLLTNGLNTIMLQGFNNTFGMNISSLQLAVRGHVLINKLGVKLDNMGGMGRIQNLNQFVNIRTQGMETLPVAQILRIDRSFAGDELMEVSMRASSMRGLGMAQLLINGMAVGFAQQVGIYSQNVVFKLDNLRMNRTIGRDINSIQIELRGAFEVETLSAKILNKQGRRF